MADRFKTLGEIAAELRISHETARRAVLDGHLEGFQVRGHGSMWRIESKSFRDFLAKAHKSADAAGCAADGNTDQIIKAG